MVVGPLACLASAFASCSRCSGAVREGQICLWPRTCFWDAGHQKLDGHHGVLPWSCPQGRFHLVIEKEAQNKVRGQVRCPTWSLGKPISQRLSTVCSSEGRVRWKYGGARTSRGT